MSDFKKVISNSGNKEVVLVNRESDPISWIVYVYKKILFFKKRIASYWFVSRQEAEEYAANYKL